jgi:hypothetical protein
MARKTDQELAAQYGIADPRDSYGAFSAAAYALSNKFKCHSCKPLSYSAHDGVGGYGVPRHELRGLDSQQADYLLSGGNMYDVLLAFAREMAKRYAQRMQGITDSRNKLFDSRQAA